MTKGCLPNPISNCWVAVRCDRLRYANESLESRFKRWGVEDFQIVAHDFAPKQVLEANPPDA
jgi:hypothetical protein